MSVGVGLLPALFLKELPTIGVSKESDMCLHKRLGHLLGLGRLEGR